MKRADIIILMMGIVLVGTVGAFARLGRRASPAAPNAAAEISNFATNPDVSANASSVAQIQTVPAAIIGDPNATVQVPVLVYHTIGMPDSPNESPMQRHYRIDPQIFAQQMQYLQTNGYTPITFSALANYYLHGTAIPAKPVVITFDDGWNTQYKYAAPVLEADHFTATFFIISNLIGGAYMTWPEIQDLAGRGFEIGSHSQTHPMLAQVSPAQLHNEIFGSKAKLESEIGMPVTTFAYPYYNYDNNVIAQLQAAGYIAARAGWESAPNSSATIYALKSQEVVNNPDPFSSITENP